ncbi:MAG: DUF1847 domain-containing protein [Sulfolobales archaeon]
MSESVNSPNCAKCKPKPCYKNPDAPKPSFCPMVLYRELIELGMSMYNDEARRVHRAASLVEKEGYCVWPRLREIVEFARKLGLEKLGVAFCIGLSSEAEYVVRYLESKGFKVYSVCCKCGGVDKTRVGLREEDKLSPGSHESMCNPIVQAELLNSVGTELNVVLGLCVGHDTLFIKYSKAPVTYLAVKDRVTGHNPLAAIYASNYFKPRL